MKTPITAILLTLALSACSVDCNDQKDDTRERYGSPEEVETYDSGNYHSHTWWYWSIGFSRNFTWTDDSGSCEVSDYTFSPISDDGGFF